jgi:hypothetical protein
MKNYWLFIVGIVFIVLSAGAKDDNDRLNNSGVITGPKAVFPQTGPSAATVNGSQIVLSDGRIFQLIVSSSQSNSPQVIMNSPVGATVTIAYADGSDTFTSQVPFVYTVPESIKYMEHFKLTVDEGVPGKVWFVRLQHNPYTAITIK